MTAFTYRPAKTSDIPQLVALYNAQYARKKDASYFLWQYFNTVYQTVLICACIDDKIIGMFGLQKKKLNNGAIVGQAIDLLVAPEWRGKGVFKNLGIRAMGYFDKLDLLCVFPNKSGKSACEKAFGWKTVGKIDSMCVRKGELKNPSLCINLPSETIFCKFDHDNVIRNWRFNQHPDYKYSYIHVDSKTFAITKIFQDPIDGQKVGDIVDFECEMSNYKTLKELFYKACVYLFEQNIQIITTWALPHTPLYVILNIMGFKSMPQERFFCVNILNPEYELLYDIKRWHLIQADTEIY